MNNKQPEALRLADAIENGVPTPTKADVSAELRRQHARIVELETGKVLNDRKQRFAIAEALGLGNANYAWSYLHDQIKSLLKCEEDLIALRKQAAAQPAAQGMEQDAARYRWLRNHGFHSASAELSSDLDGAPFVCFVMRVHIPEPISLPYEEQEWTACDTDVAIDAALVAQAKQDGANKWLTTNLD